MTIPCKSCSKTVTVLSHGIRTKECCFAPGDIEKARKHCPLCANYNLLNTAKGSRGQAVQ